MWPLYKLTHEYFEEIFSLEFKEVSKMISRKHIVHTSCYNIKCTVTGVLFALFTAVFIRPGY